MQIEVWRMSDEDIFRNFSREKAEEILLQRYDRYVRTLVGNLVNIPRTLFDEDDLLQWARLALVEAIRKFDPARNVKFITFLVSYVKKYVMRETERALLINRRRLKKKDELLIVPLSSLSEADDEDEEGEKEVEELAIVFPLEGIESKDLVRKALRYLNEEERLIIIQMMDSNFDFRDIAELYGREVAKRLWKRARRKLKRIILKLLEGGSGHVRGSRKGRRRISHSQEDADGE